MRAEGTTLFRLNVLFTALVAIAASISSFDVLLKETRLI